MIQRVYPGTSAALQERAYLLVREYTDEYAYRAIIRHLVSYAIVLHADEGPVTVELTRQTSPDPSLLRINETAFKHWLTKKDVKNQARIFAALEELGFVRRGHVKLCLKTPLKTSAAPILEVMIRWRDWDDKNKGEKGWEKGWDLL